MFLIKLKQVHINDRPRFKEFDDTLEVMYPNQARLRNITYQTTIYVDLEVQENHINPDGSIKNIRTSEHNKLRIGHVPVMVKSRFCSLHGEETDILEVGECVHDQGGYFVINGSEKVIVA